MNLLLNDFVVLWKKTAWFLCFLCMEAPVPADKPSWNTAHSQIVFDTLNVFILIYFSNYPRFNNETGGAIRLTAICGYMHAMFQHCCIHSIGQ